MPAILRAINYFSPLGMHCSAPFQLSGLSLQATVFTPRHLRVRRSQSHWFRSRRCCMSIFQIRWAFWASSRNCSRCREQYLQFVRRVCWLGARDRVYWRRFRANCAVGVHNLNRSGLNHSGLLCWTPILTNRRCTSESEH